MSDWSYDDAIDAHPVQYGVSYDVGRHTLRCVRMQDVDVEEPVDLVYADPPWNAGIQRQFNEAAGVDGGPADHVILYAASLADVHGVPWYIEVGPSTPDHVVEMLHARHRFEVTYHGGDRDCLLLTNAVDPPDLDGADDQDTPRLAMTHHGDEGTVLDPCVGIGTTLLCAEAAGWTCIGYEMNPKKLAKAMAAWEAAHG